ncbi:MAG: molybdopterin-dependent oxidoreductase [Chloroflexi bacterium]|nr:molybdopterin-dependent oxidoreductase [Chloroflexota bacterium]
MVQVKKGAVKEDVWVKTFCHGCFNATCGLMVHRVDGVVVGVKGDPENPYNAGKICAKAFGQIMGLYDPYRPTTPLVRTNPEKGIGVDPKWKAVSWEEAYDLAAKKVAEVRNENPDDAVLSFNDLPLLDWLPAAVRLSFGTKNFFFNDPVCGSSVHCQPFITMSTFHQYPDIEHCRYLVLWGSNKGGMLQHCGTTATLDIAEKRRKKGLKIVCVDPVQSNMGAKANEWVPIRPGTDMAMALAWLNVLLNETGHYDEEYLKQYTNAPYLVKEDGYYLRDESGVKPLMWDAAEQKAKPFDADFKDVTILGSYEVNGIACRPAFQVLKDHVKQYTPEWASPITTIPAGTIRRLATEFGEAASIGSTIKIEGVTLPYRPAAIHWYTGVSQHTNGYWVGFVMQTIMMVIGAVNVPGGTVGDDVILDYPYQPEDKRTLWSGKSAFPGMSEEGLIVTSPFSCFGGTRSCCYPSLKPGTMGDRTGWDLIPLSFSTQSLWAMNQLQPELFNNKIPKTKMVLGFRCNDISNQMNPQEAARASKDQFRIVCDSMVDETAEFADIFFPMPMSFERHGLGTEINGYMGGTMDNAHYCVNFRQPVVPENEIIGKEMLDVWMEIADRAGFLADYNRIVNIVWDLPKGYRLDEDKKYPFKEIIRRFAEGVWNKPVEQLAQDGHIKWRRSVKERYPRPFFKGRSPIYFEHHLKAGAELRAFVDAQGIKWDTSAYTALPEWKPTATFVDNKAGYDLVAIPFRLPVLTHFWMTRNPWLLELSEHHPWGMNLVMNADTAAKQGIKDGDELVVEAVSGYTQRGKVKLTQCIHPEVVAVSRHGGHWDSHPVSKGKGTQFNVLVSHDIKYLDKQYSGIENCIKIRVRKAEEKGK